MMDCLVRHPNGDRGFKGLSGVQIPAELRKIAAGYLNADPVAPLKCDARTHQINLQFEDLAGNEQPGFV